MSSTSPQPIPQMPPIENLAPPLPESNAAAAVQSASSIPYKKKDESLVPVEVHPENVLQADASSGSDPGNNGAAKITRITDPSSTLFSRVMKQRASSMPQTAHVQKDNTLAIFVTLCLVVMAIACGIYFVADRETRVASSPVNQIPPPAESLQKLPASPALVDEAAGPPTAQPRNPLFGNPINKAAKSAPAKQSAIAKRSAAPTLLQNKSTSIILKSQSQLSHMQYIEAEYSARKATGLAPASPDAWLALGRALYCQGRYAEAQLAFKTCIKHGAATKAAKTAVDFMSQMPALGQTR